MAMRRGIVPPPPADVKKPEAPKPVGKIFTPNARIGREPIPTTGPQHVAPSGLLTSSGQPVGGSRVGIVDQRGQPIMRGLSKATTEAQSTERQGSVEKCLRCGEDTASADMVTLVPNVERSSNPLRICKKCCMQVYKDPNNVQEQWRPFVPQIRFDGRGRPYDAHEQEVTVGDLINRDTYHDPREAEHFQADGPPPVVHPSTVRTTPIGRAPSRRRK